MNGSAQKFSLVSTRRLAPRPQTTPASSSPQGASSRFATCLPPKRSCLRPNRFVSLKRLPTFGANDQRKRLRPTTNRHEKFSAAHLARLGRPSAASTPVFQTQLPPDARGPWASKRSVKFRRGARCFSAISPVCAEKILNGANRSDHAPSFTTQRSVSPSAQLPCTEHRRETKTLVTNSGKTGLALCTRRLNHARAERSNHSCGLGLALPILPRFSCARRASDLDLHDRGVRRFHARGG